MDMHRIQVIRVEHIFMAAQGDKHAEPGLGRHRKLVLRGAFQIRVIHGAYAEHRVHRQQLQFFVGHMKLRNATHLYNDFITFTVYNKDDKVGYYILYL